MPITKRRLTDLWVTGREIVLDDGGGDPVEVWLQKLNPVEAAETGRHCDAARARILAVRTNRDAEAFQATRAAVLDYGDDIEQLVGFLSMEERGRAQRMYEAKTSSEDEWGEDNYLQGLHDAWNEGLKDTWARDHDDSEAKRVHDEMARFDKLVKDCVDNDMDVLCDVLRELPITELQDRLTARLMEMDANEAWLGELHRCQIWFGTRDPANHKERYFSSRGEVDMLSTETYTRLRTAYEALEVDAAEGKALGVTPPSSPSAVLPAEAATGSSVGLVAATP